MAASNVSQAWLAFPRRTRAFVNTVSTLTFVLRLVLTVPFDLLGRLLKWVGERLQEVAADMSRDVGHAADWTLRRSRVIRQWEQDKADAVEAKRLATLAEMKDALAQFAVDPLEIDSQRPVLKEWKA